MHSVMRSAFLEFETEMETLAAKERLQGLQVPEAYKPLSCDPSGDSRAPAAASKRQGSRWWHLLHRQLAVRLPSDHAGEKVWTLF